MYHIEDRKNDSSDATTSIVSSVLIAFDTSTDSNGQLLPILLSFN
jgi:hypothetical protein